MAAALTNPRTKRQNKCFRIAVETETVLPFKPGKTAASLPEAIGEQIQPSAVGRDLSLAHRFRSRTENKMYLSRALSKLNSTL